MVDTKYDVQQIREMLNERVEELAEELLPDGKRYGNDWQCSGHNSPFGEPVDVVIRGRKAGMVSFWQRARTGGDLLDLIGAVHGTDFKHSLQWACQYLGVSSESYKENKSPEMKRALDYRRQQKEADRTKEAEDRRRLAYKIWCEATPLSDTPAEEYLKSRKIGFGVYSLALRYHPSLEYPRQTGEERRERPWYPAMIALVQGSDRKFRGIQRIFITKEGEKAPEKNTKVSLGPILGGAVYLFDGSDDHLAVGEGVGTMLGVAGLTKGKCGIVAALSTSGMKAWLPPSTCKLVTIYPDGDTDKIRQTNQGTAKVLQSPGLIAANELKSRLDVAGLECRIQPTPKNGRDYLDVWEASQAHLTA